MRWLRIAALACVVLAVSAQAAAASSGGTFVLTQTGPGKRYAPTFTGNGWLGIRAPATGQGPSGGTVPAQAELAGFYAKPRKFHKIAERVQQRASIPTWSTLRFSDGHRAFSLTAGHTTG